MQAQLLEATDKITEAERKVSRGIHIPSLGTRPSKNRKEGLVNGAGWKCTLQNVRNFINC